jgi:hypothetical protein
MTQEFVAANPGMAERYIAALNHANVQMREALSKGGDDAEVVYAAIMKANGIERDAAVRILKEQPPATLQDLLTAHSPLSLTSPSGVAAQIAQQARLAVIAGAIKKAPANPHALIVDRATLEAAQAVKAVATR